MKYPIQYISASSLKKFNTCAYSFKAKYILKMKQPGNEHFALGTSLHGALELQVKMKKRNGKNLPLNVILKQYQKLASREAESLDFDAKNSFRDMYLAGHNLVEQGYFKLIELNPIDAEKYFKVEVGYDLPIMGFMDLIFEDGLLDSKTAGKPWPKSKIDSDFQFTVYNEAYRVLYGQYPKRLGILLFDKKKALSDPKNSVYVQPVTRNGMHREKLDLAVEDLFRGINDNNYPRCMKPNCWACSP